MADYEAKALAEARRQGATAAEIRVLTYGDVAVLAGVVVKPDGASPADFFYRNVRNVVGSTLAADEAQAVQDIQKSELESALASSVSLKDKEVEVNADGELVVKDKASVGEIA